MSATPLRAVPPERRARIAAAFDKGSPGRGRVRQMKTTLWRSRRSFWNGSHVEQARKLLRHWRTLGEHLAPPLIDCKPFQISLHHKRGAPIASHKAAR